MNSPGVTSDYLKQPQDTPISYFGCLTDQESSQVCLGEVFELIRSGIGFKTLIDKIRREGVKSKLDALKRNLPAITFSGLFVGSRRIEGLVLYSGIICLDIDNVDNILAIKQIICTDPLTYCAFISPSGRGLKVLIKTPGNVRQHSENFRCLQTYYLQKYDLKIDQKCQDITRLCFFSHDPEIYINAKSDIFHSASLCNENRKDKKDTSKTDLFRQVETITARIEDLKLDITVGYEIWLRIAFALADALGERGRTYFHRLSRFNSAYRIDAANKQYTACLKSGKKGITIKTFFGVAKEHGISLDMFSKEGVQDAPLLDSMKTTEDKLETRNIPLITRVEHFLSERFDFRRNIINEKLECRLNEDPSQGWTVVNENAISRLLQKSHFNYSPNKTADLLNSDFVNDYNPITNYFGELPPWDCRVEPSYIEKLGSLVKAKDQGRFNVQLKKMFIRSVACSTVVGNNNSNFNKHVFVLVSANQSGGKSTLLRWLCPPGLQDYYLENITFDKDGNIALAQCFLINLDELTTLRKYDVDHLKTFISKASINERLPYGRTRKFYPRRANFLASTNNLEFLVDETGNVRWLCHEIEEINFGYSDPKSEYFIDIDRLWAEAYSRFKSGEAWQLTSQELLENESANKVFQLISKEEELLIKYFEPGEKDKGFFLTTTEIEQKIASKGYSITQLSTKKLGSVLRKLKFPMGTERMGRYPLKGYYVKERKTEE